MCSNSNAIDLIGGGALDGLLVFDKNTTEEGSVCGDGITTATANVICTQICKRQEKRYTVVFKEDLFLYLYKLLT